MKVDIITCYESNEERMGFVYDACSGRGYEVKAYTSDFSHIKKDKRKQIPSHFISVEALPYRKNLSAKRMFSHYRFSGNVFKYVEKDSPDLIWLIAPANSLILQASRYKKKYPDTKIIIDIIDMWPESLPIKFSNDIFPLNLWKNIRKSNINCADHLVTECDLYQKILKNEYRGKITTIHWARDSKAQRRQNELNDDVLSLCYIGSINNIIDTERIADVISKIDMPVKMHVIGEGENTKTFINRLSQVCDVEYHGAIRDEKRKTEIFDQCHAGINMYKEGLYIGLTVKCIDYFEHGLPIINNIQGDTWDLVKEYDAGIDLKDPAKVDAQKLIKMRENDERIYQLFEDHFTKEVFTDKCLKVIDEVLG